MLQLKKKSWLLTGTCTEVGKTWVGCALLRELALQNPQAVVRGIKPFESGLGSVAMSQWDATLLGEASNPPCTSKITLGKGYGAPLAPWHAAQCLNETPDMDAIKLFIENNQKQSDFLLIEGAGGIAVPITFNDNYADLAQLLQVGVIVVAKDELGVINGTMLTAAYLADRQIPLVAIILNRHLDYSPGEHNLEFFNQHFPGKVFLNSQLAQLAKHLSEIEAI